MEPATISKKHALDGAPIKACLHCGEPSLEGQQFCCAGCEAAYKLHSTPLKAQQFAPFVHGDDDGSKSLTLSVTGIHCAGCIRLIENALIEEVDVTAARVNMTSERLHFTWMGDAERSTSLAEKVTQLGYGLKPLSDAADKVSSAEEKSLLKAIAIAGFAAGNMMLISIVLWSYSSDDPLGGDQMGAATRDLFHWLSALIAVPTVLFSGRPFFKSALAVLKQGHTNMDVPISLAVLLATIMSLYEAINHGAHVYFDSAVMLLFFLLTGRYLDARAKGKARASAAGLLAKLAGVARVIEGDKTREVPIIELKAGMICQVAVGENIPADGTVHAGVSEVDNSLITGETMPVMVSKDERVFAGTTNIMAPFRMTVSAASDQSLLSEIVRMMETAEQGAARYVRLADRAARLYTPTVHFLALATILGWLFIAGAVWQVALLHAVTVLIITCPCALGLAVPVVQMLATGALMRAGILLKSGDALEKLAKIDTVVFDKTGTLTEGVLELQGRSDISDPDMQMAASMAMHSRHPLSKAITDAWDGPLMDLSVSETPGKGLSAHRDGNEIKLGRASWVEGATESDDHAPEFWLQVDGSHATRFAFSDAPRADTQETLKALASCGLDLHILSGDRDAAVAALAASVGIIQYQSEASPIDKTNFIKELITAGRSVLVVGDGLNDAPMLASASVSMSPASAVDITQNTADIVFQGSSLASVLFAYRIAVKAHLLVRQNFGLAVLYNLIAVPFAVMGFVTPLIAAIAMSSSSLVVIANAFRINLTKKGT